MSRQYFAPWLAAIYGCLFATMLTAAMAGTACGQSLGAFWGGEATATGGNPVTDSATCGSLGGGACVPGQIYSQGGSTKGVTNACGQNNDPLKSGLDSSIAVTYGLLSGSDSARAAVGSQGDYFECGKEGASGYGQSVSGFTDSLTIVSDTLPQGTPVKLRFKMTLSSKVTSFGVPASLYCDGQLSAQATLNLNPGGGFYTLAHTECSGTNAQKTVIPIVSSVGAQQSFEGQIILTAETDEYVDSFDFPWGPSGHTSINSLHSPAVARYAVEVLTPGASYVALSGTTYPTN